jgi:CRISPR-associated endonuclease Csn1
MKEKVQYRLGVDIGTSSVAIYGFALENGKPSRPICSDLVIFGEPVQKDTGGKLTLKNARRRLARSMRKTLARKASRISKLLHLAQMLGVGVNELGAASSKLRSPHEIWRLRAEAATKKVELAELFLVLLRMAKSRGYFGKAPSVKKKSGDLGKVSAGIQASEQLLASGDLTLGQAIWRRRLEDPNNKSPKMRKLSEDGTYVLRRHVESEFDRVIATQTEFHPILAASLIDGFGFEFAQKASRADTRYFWGLKPETVAQALRHTLFFQHPLKGFADKVGRCALDRTSRRVVAAHPAAQAFLIEKALGDLRWGDGKNAPALSRDQRDFLRDILVIQKEAKFSALYKKLQSAGLMHEDGLTFNLHSARREELKGSSTRAVLSSLGVFDQFQALGYQVQSNIFIAWADHIPAPELWGFDDQRQKVLEKFGSEVAHFFDRLAESEDGLERLNAAGFQGARMRYGADVLVKLTDFMRIENVDEYTARERLYPESVLPQQVTGVLPVVYEPQRGQEPLDGELYIVSPVVRRALQETRKVLMRCIKRHGPPAEMVIELMREMKHSLEERKTIDSDQARKERANQEAKQELLNEGYAASRSNVIRYRLWKQQAERCPYSGVKLNLSQALDGASTHFEHIVPRRIQGVGNRFEDLVLASRKMNDLKGADETPYAAAHSLRNAGKWNWDTTVGACKSIEKDNPAFKAKSKMIQSTDRLEARGLDDDAFVDRQQHETAWIGKVVGEWCKHLCTNVTVVRGGLTAALRKTWGLDSILEQVREAEGKHANVQRAQKLFYKEHPFKTELVFDKRCDHRQHLIDAAVIALSTGSNYTQLVRWQHARAKGNKHGEPTPDCPVPDLRNQLVKLLTGYEVWHKPDRLLDGELFDAMPFRLHSDGKTLSKKGKVASKGFNPELDKTVAHTDRRGRPHKKVLKSAETACMKLTQDGLVPVGLAEFRRKYVSRTGVFNSPSDEKIFFKGDVVYSPSKDRFFRIAMLSSRDGLQCVPTMESHTFDELSGTRITASMSKMHDLSKLIVAANQMELARLVQAQRVSRAA